MNGLMKMLHYLNNNDLEGTYSRIIIYIITNREKINSMNISDLSNVCYVSPATISRFSKFFGYPSFQAMKLDLQREPSLEYTLRLSKNEYYRLNDSPDSFFLSLGTQIIEGVKDTLQTVDLSKVDKLLEEIMKYDKVYLFGYDSTLDILKKFQSTFLSNDKLLIMAFPSNLQLELSKKLDNNSLCIVVSSYGTIFTKLPNTIWNITNSSAKKIFITQGTTNIFTSAFDQNISISSKPNPITGNFCMDFFFEYLGKRSLKLFSSSHHK